MRPMIALAAAIIVATLGVPSPVASAAPAACASQSSLDQFMTNLINPAIEPNHENCYEIAGTCSVSTRTEVQATRTVVFLVVVAIDRTDITENVWTTINCSGTWSFSAIHWGGVGPRWSQSQFGEGDKAPKSACNYVAPMGACRTPELGGPWSYMEVFQGKPVLQPNLPMCGTGVHTNVATHETVNAILSGSGPVKESLCRSVAATVAESSEGHLTLCITECQRI